MVRGSRIRSGLVVLLLVASQLVGVPGLNGGIRALAAPTLTRVSVSSAGVQANGDSVEVDLSADGNVVAFTSWASNLVEGDSNGLPDVFVHDLTTGVTERVSVSTSGVGGNAASSEPSISGDGRYIAFVSEASNLVPDDTNGDGLPDGSPIYGFDIFVHDRVANTTVRASMNSVGEQQTVDEYDLLAGSPSISDDGRFLAFHSNADNLGSPVANETMDVFLRDRDTQTTTHVSFWDNPLSELDKLFADSFGPVISPDAELIGYQSEWGVFSPNDDQGVFSYDRMTGLGGVFAADGDVQQSIPVAINFGSTAAGHTVAYTAEIPILSDAVISLPRFRWQGQMISPLQERFETLLTEFPPQEGGDQGVYSSSAAGSLTPDGRLFAYSDDLSGGGPGVGQVYVYDRIRQTAFVQSVGATGAEGNGDSFGGRLSADGSRLAFSSAATNLVAGDSNGFQDVFVANVDMEAVGTPGRYVSIGDSYQSGQSVRPYFAETDIPGVNECHRSPQAYPELVAKAPQTPLVDTHWACSEVEIDDLSNTSFSTSGPPWNEGSQYDRLNHGTTLVTIGVGGNDAGFDTIIEDCERDGWLGLNLLFSCMETFDAQVTEAIEALRTSTPERKSIGEVIEEIRDRAPNARILWVGYPRFFTQQGSNHRLLGCRGFSTPDQRWVNDKLGDLNDLLEAEVRRMDAEFVDIEDAFSGHELCNNFFSTGEWITGRVPLEPKESFHPKASGHEAMAEAVLAAFDAPPPGPPPLNIFQNGTLAELVEVLVDQVIAAFTTKWSGSDVEMTLISPSGRVIDRSTIAEDVTHFLSPSSETFQIADPGPGVWTVELFGADVPPDGEEVQLRVYQGGAPNQGPVAVLSQVTNGFEVTLDSAGSFDPDGTIVAYEWHMGDGTILTEPSVTYTYAEGPSAYLPSLIVTDDDGSEGFATGDPVGFPEPKTAMWFKEMAYEQVVEASDTENPQLAELLIEASNHILTSLTDPAWIDDDRLGPDGESVFESERLAVGSLLDTAATGLLWGEREHQVVAAIFLMLEADRLLAEVVVAEMPDGEAKDQALALIDAAATLNLDGDYIEAIDAYQSAWTLAQEGPPPVAEDDSVAIDVDETVLIDVLANDSDPDGELDESTLEVTVPPASGIAAVVGGEIQYTPEAGFDGTDQFEYQICDLQGLCDTATATITVGASTCTITGTAGDDVLVGTSGDDVICGLAGDDQIDGKGGNDILIGGSGNDLLSGGNGADEIHGGRGADEIHGNAGDDVLYGGRGADLLHGGGGDDQLHGRKGDDYLQGGAGNDTLLAGKGSDLLEGGTGDDILRARRGADILKGGKGTDTLYGGRGADTLKGGKGADLLYGRRGHDTLEGGNGNDELRGGRGNDTLEGGNGTDLCRGETTGDCET